MTEKNQWLNESFFISLPTSVSPYFRFRSISQKPMGEFISYCTHTSLIGGVDGGFTIVASGAGFISLQMLNHQAEKFCPMCFNLFNWLHIQAHALRFISEI